MLNLVTVAFAQVQQAAPAAQSAAQPGGGSMWTSFIPIIAMIVIFYFLLIRPSQKKEKDRKKMLEAVQKGDKVITVGGIYGTVVNVKPEENIIVLKIGDGTKVDFAKSAIQSKVS
ncbi:MAG TPA: preprotein translocase subunit YajC [Spirochaetota bacterium]|nr:preprotein translocase subunit YajC [Spirochaetota bacterium]HQP50376.1 preprotein translocase subunit YajC [Spirochaetota bacterium]